MKIEQFVAQSLGEWKSMRSSHSLAFKQFEEVISKINIRAVNISDPKVTKLILSSECSDKNVISPFQIDWEAESDWGDEPEKKDMAGSSLLIPIEQSSNTGLILRSIGYTEKTKVLSSFHFLNDETLVLSTTYQNSVTEERIWFVSENVRCRSSIVKSKESQAILQASFCSEVRKIP